MKHFLYLILVVLIISGCKKTSTPKPTEPEKHGIDIYVFGNSTVGNKSVAGYWKNGVLTIVSDPNSNSSAHAMAVRGSDIYLAGYMPNPSTGITNATYWKNTTAVFLSDNRQGSVATAITINGTDVYIAGYVLNGDGKQSTAVYWKNGERHDLDFQAANAIAVIGPDIYLAGETSTNEVIATGIFWKNDVITNLTPHNYSEINGISIIGANVYLSGIAGGGAHNVATYWKNGFPVQLQPDTSDSRAAFILVNGPDIYAGGYVLAKNSIIPQAYYWKNGNSVKLATRGVVASIALNDGDVYFSGTITDSNNNPTAVYWKNGTMVPLQGAYHTSDNSDAAYAGDIIVVKY